MASQRSRSSPLSPPAAQCDPNGGSGTTGSRHSVSFRVLGCSRVFGWSYSLGSLVGFSQPPSTSGSLLKSAMAARSTGVEQRRSGCHPLKLDAAHSLDNLEVRHLLIAQIEDPMQIPLSGIVGCHSAECGNGPSGSDHGHPGRTHLGLCREAASTADSGRTAWDLVLGSRPSSEARATSATATRSAPVHQAPAEARRSHSRCNPATVELGKGTMARAQCRYSQRSYQAENGLAWDPS